MKAPNFSATYQPKRKPAQVRLGECGHPVVNRFAVVCRACYLASSTTRRLGYAGVRRRWVALLDDYWRETGLVA